MSDAFAIFILVLGVAGLFVILHALRGQDPRHAEDAARTFYDEHGHWPGQTVEEAEAERRELARVYRAVGYDEDDPA